MTSNNTVDVDSVHRFVDALVPITTDLLAVANRLALNPGGATAGAALQWRDAAELLLVMQAEFRALIQLESGAWRPMPQSINLREGCQAVVDLLREHATDNGMDLSFHAPDDLTVMMDPAWFEQLLRRLLFNAIRYGRPGAQVCVSIKRRAAGGWLLRAADSGGGMSRDQCHALFRPFERLGKELCATDGLGMGLAVAQRMALALGGQLTVRSRLGVGSVFRVEWPQP